MDQELERAMTCPKWNKCPAAICPLIPGEGRHLAGEPVCLWLRELHKTGGRERVRGFIPAELAEPIAEAAPDLLARHSALKTQVLAASKTPSKLRRPGNREAA